METEFYHHGIKGQRWGVRRYQNPDGTLTPAGKKHLQKLDNKWIKKESGKIEKQARKNTSRELNEYGRELMRDPNAYTKAGRLTSATINSYNRRMASLMNEQVSGLQSPSGKVVQFVAKRGEIGVFMALADQGYNIEQLKNGIYDSGKVAYRKTVINKVGY